MNRNLLLLLLLIIASSASADDLVVVEQQAAKWYSHDYGALWNDSKSIRLEDVQLHYLPGFRIHRPNGGFDVGSNPSKVLAEMMEFFGANWVGSELSNLKVSALSRSAVAIWAQWLNRNADGSTFTNCVSYIAERTAEAGWQFTDFFTVDCNTLGSLWE